MRVVMRAARFAAASASLAAVAPAYAQQYSCIVEEVYSSLPEPAAASVAEKHRGLEVKIDRIGGELIVSQVSVGDGMGDYIFKVQVDDDLLTVGTSDQNMRATLSMFKPHPDRGHQASLTDQSPDLVLVRMMNCQSDDRALKEQE